jgi:hypothetical protein
MPLASDALPTNAAALAALLAVALALLAANAWRRLRGSTLAAPAAWAVAAAASVAAVELALAWNAEPAATLGASLARYAAAVGVCCPLTAVLGAKRPQDRGWQWIVLSLWIVLLVPAGQAWAGHTSNQLVLPYPWRALLAALVMLGPLNYLPTRWAGAAVLATIGQLLLLKPWLFGDGEPSATSAWALAALLLAALLATLTRRRSANAAPSPPLEEFTYRWLNFRNNWGAFWALRILNRINETAVLSNWPVRLHWNGFAPLDAAAPTELDERIAAHITQTLDSLLRRFEAPAPPT